MSNSFGRGFEHRRLYFISNGSQSVFFGIKFYGSEWRQSGSGVSGFTWNCSLFGGIQGLIALDWFRIDFRNLSEVFIEC